MAMTELVSASHASWQGRPVNFTTYSDTATVHPAPDIIPAECH